MACFSAKVCIPIDEYAARKLLNKWVDLLDLKEWEIVLKWKVDPRRMGLENSAGCTSYNEVSRQAVIEIADPELYEHEIDMDGFSFDYEQTLVHELLHLKMSLIDESENKMQNRAVHILVESMARSLVRAMRYTEMQDAKG